MAVNWGLQGQGFNPMEALQAYGQARATETRKTALRQFAAGDAQGAQNAALSNGDLDLYSKLGALTDEQRQQTAQHAKTMAGVALSLSQAAPEQRAAAYTATIRPQLEAQGFRPEELDKADLSDAGLRGYIALGTNIEKQLEAYYKQQEPYTLAPGAQRMVGDKVVASNAPNDPETIRTLQAAGIDPQSPEGREAILGHVNPPQFMQFGSDATGRELIQTRGAVGGVTGQGGPAGPAIETAMLTAIPGTTVTSRQRSAQHNAEVGGAPGSAHLSDDGRDFVPPRGVSMQQFEETARRQFPNMYVLNEGDHVHVGLPKGQRSGGPTVVARTAPVASDGEGKPPSGYRWNAGRLEPIPGGPADPAGAGNRNTTSNRKAEADLRKEFDNLPEVKNFRTVRTQAQTIGQLARQPSAQNDIAMIFSYMKVLDPTSVVREGEFATAQNAAGVPDQVRNMFNRAQSGQRLNPEQRLGMVRSAEQIYSTARNVYNERAQAFRGYAQDNGVDPGRVASTYSPRPKASQSAAPTAPPGWSIRKLP